MSAAQRGRIKSVIVEDEQKIGRYIKNRIECLDSDFSVLAIAENGKEALQFIEKEHPQVVFTDIAMPVMDGLELSRMIQNTYPGILVVIISGYSDFGYAQKAMKYGVFNYILKPLEDEKLTDVLLDIKKNLTYVKTKQERQVLYSDAWMFRRREGICYAIMTVCVGNLIYDVQDILLTEYYRGEMQKIPFRKIMEQLCGDKENWYLADEQFVNQKVIGIQMKKGEEAFPEERASALLQLIGAHTGLAVHICYSAENREVEEVWNAAKYQRYLIQKELVVGNMQLLEADKQEGSNQDLLEIVKVKLSSYIKNYFLSTDLKNFTTEIQKILKYMIKNRAPQMNIEKVSLYVLKLLEFSGQDYDPEFLEKMQVTMQRSIGLAATEGELVDRLMEGFQDIGSYMEKIYEKNIETRVLEYVDNNFLVLESLEQVADAFGYNYTYLSRLFRKVAGMPMNRYITEKKMELAKKLMQQNPDMILEKVCEMCGYNDYRYFSRVFKVHAGVTPSEYRTEEKTGEQN